ncbi:MAG TPA: hypothetical protein VFN46_02475 [Acetobacteraceae bacterium]|nr:hypothetical protein [Acetobacteraceae bacterium]
MFDLGETPAAIGGRRVTLNEAIGAAAHLLGVASLPVIAGLRTDAAGAVAAAALARRLRGVLDHADSEAALRDFAAMRSAGRITATPMLVRAEADVVLLVGDMPADVAAMLALDRPPPLDEARRPRRVERIAGGDDVTERIGCVRALVKRRAIEAPPALVALADVLRGARYGAVVWAAAALPTLAVEMLCGLIEDLNAKTRFAGVPLPGAGNVAGVAQALGWETGFPFRVAFRDGVPRHDPWRFDATRLVDGGEADAALWLDALGEGPPPWRRPVKLVALAPPGARFATAPDVALAVGRPGVDHAAALFHSAAAALLASGPAAARGGPAAADLLARITAALPC